MPRRIVLLSNPTSGRGAGARSATAAAGALRARGVEVQERVGRDATEALQLARDAVREGMETLVVVGGDGMVHVALQAVAGTSTCLGMIPAGTGNDVARYFDIPRDDVAAAVDVVLAGRTREVDLGRAGERSFVTVLAAGFDAMVNERANAMRWPRGRARYTLATVAELRTLRPIPYTLELDGRVEQLDATMVAVGNGPSFGGGLRITEGAELDDGWLDVVVIAPMSRRELLRTYPKLFAGTHVSHPGYRHERVCRVRIDAPGITAYADGERVAPLPLTVEVQPAALRMLVAGGAR